MENHRLPLRCRRTSSALGIGYWSDSTRSFRPRRSTTKRTLLFFFTSIMGAAQGLVAGSIIPCRLKSYSSAIKVSRSFGENRYIGRQWGLAFGFNGNEQSPYGRVHVPMGREALAKVSSNSMSNSRTVLDCSCVRSGLMAFSRVSIVVIGVLLSSCIGYCVSRSGRTAFTVVGIGAWMAGYAVVRMVCLGIVMGCRLKFVTLINDLSSDAETTQFAMSRTNPMG